MVEMCTDFEKDKISIVDDIDDCINTWCTKKRISKIILLEWKTTVFKQIVKETVELKNKSVHQKTSTNSLGNHQIWKILADLHKNYVAIVINKANTMWLLSV